MGLMYLNISGAIGPCDIVHIHSNTGAVPGKSKSEEFSTHCNTHESIQLYRIATGSFVAGEAVVPSTQAAFGP